jgi:hypothetical protein
MWAHRGRRRIIERTRRGERVARADVRRPKSSSSARSPLCSSTSCHFTHDHQTNTANHHFVFVALPPTIEGTVRGPQIFLSKKAHLRVAIAPRHHALSLSRLTSGPESEVRPLRTARRPRACRAIVDGERRRAFAKALFTTLDFSPLPPPKAPPAGPPTPLPRPHTRTTARLDGPTIYRQGAGTSRAPGEARAGRRRSSGRSSKAPTPRDRGKQPPARIQGRVVHAGGQ